MECIAEKRQGREKAIEKTDKQGGHRRQEPNSQENEDVYLAENTDLYFIKDELLTRKGSTQEYDEEVKGPQLQRSLAMWCYCETETQERD